MIEYTFLKFTVISLLIMTISIYLTLAIYTYISLKEPMTSTDKEYKEIYKVSFVRCLVIPFIVYYHITRFIFIYGSLWYCFKKLIGFYFITYPMGLRVMYVIPKVMVVNYNKPNLPIEGHRLVVFREYMLALIDMERG